METYLIIYLCGVVAAVITGIYMMKDNYCVDLRDILLTIVLASTSWLGTVVFLFIQCVDYNPVLWRKKHKKSRGDW